MKKTAIVLSLLCFILTGSLYFLNKQTVSSGGHKEFSVTVSDFAYTEPEIINSDVTTLPMVPKVVETIKKEDSESVAVEQPSLVFLNEENMKLARCVILGPLQEKRLPQLRGELKNNNLIAPMIIESLPTKISYGVFLGPFSSNNQAIKYQKKLKNKGLEKVQVVIRKTEIFLRLNELSSLNEAEKWARDFVNVYGIQKIKLIRIPETKGDQIQLIFNNIEEKHAFSVLKISKKHSIPASLCPEY